MDTAWMTQIIFFLVFFLKIISNIFVAVKECCPVIRHKCVTPVMVRSKSIYSTVYMNLFNKGVVFQFTFSFDLTMQNNALEKILFTGRWPFNPIKFFL